MLDDQSGVGGSYYFVLALLLSIIMQTLDDHIFAANAVAVNDYSLLTGLQLVLLFVKVASYFRP